MANLVTHCPTVYKDRKSCDVLWRFRETLQSVVFALKTAIEEEPRAREVGYHAKETYSVTNDTIGNVSKLTIHKKISIFFLPCEEKF